MNAIKGRQKAGSAAALNIIRYGRPEALPERLEVAAGALSAVFASGELWSVRVGGDEIASRIYLAVRDRDWGVVPTEIALREVSLSHDSFLITYDARSVRGEIDFRWKVRIQGAADSAIVFEFEGEAATRFMKNRIGLCVNHTAADCAGTPCRLVDTNGRTTDGQFPVFVAPHQPFLDLRALSYATRTGQDVRIDFQGDVFETEDQRNWTDASYKTYSTPLSQPYPQEIEAGTRIRQSVTISAGPSRADFDPGEAVGGAHPNLSVISCGAAPKVVLPKIGLGAASHGGRLSEREMAQLKALRLSHLRVDLPLTDDHWTNTLAQGVQEASALGAQLEIAVFLSAASERDIERLASVVGQMRPVVARWIIFEAGRPVASDAVVQQVRAAVRQYTPEAMFGGGSDANFAELNRNRPDARAWDLVSFAANPQVHAFDNESVMETCAALPDILKTLQRFAAGIPLAISPVTLKPRFNAVATSGGGERPERDLPENVDPRQMSLLAAAWTVAFIASVCDTAVQSLTLFETTGWRGVMEVEDGPPIPELFPSLPGALFPVYHLLQALGKFAGDDAFASALTTPPGVAALRIQRGSQERWIIANLTADVRPVLLEGVGGAVGYFLDETTVTETPSPTPYPERLAGNMTIRLRPYATVWVDRNSMQTSDK